MILELFEYNDKQFPVRSVYIINVEYYGQARWAKFADWELWAEIEDDVNNGVEEAIQIENEIYHFCDSGFIASNPSDNEIIKYIKKRL